MLRLVSTVLLLAVATAAMPGAAAARAAGPPGRVIVKFKADAPVLQQKAATPGIALRARADDLGRRVGVALRPGAALADATQVLMADGVDSASLAARVAAQADVEYAIPDQRRRALAVPNDPLYAAGVPGNGPAVGQWYLRAPDAVVASSLDVETAWSVTTGDPSIVVAVLDTGVRFEHPDLTSVAAGGPLLPGYDMVSDAGRANDGDGRDPDPTDPGDWVTEGEANDPNGEFHACTTFNDSTGQYVGEDSSWHGTQVAGIIAARTDNGIGMASVARNVRILPVRVLGKCGGFDSDIIAGMRWAAGLAVPGVPANSTRARVINMSLGGDGSCTAAYQDAVNQVLAAGTVVVAAAGNDAGHRVSVPANCGGVIAVGGLRHVGTKVGFSNVGSEVTISAPGGNCVNTDPGSPCLYPILTTRNTGTTLPGDSSYSDSFKFSLGTSFATPLVAGTAALMLSAQPSLATADVRALLRASARPFPATVASSGDGLPLPQCQVPQFDTDGKPIDQAECYCTTFTCGAGMLDAGAAVRAAKTASVVADFEVEGLWWNAPASSESGWGLNVAQQGDVVFATWFTYDATGKAWWLSMTGTHVAANRYAGTLYQTRGPAFDAIPFDPSQVVAMAVGTGTLEFSSGGDGTFTYTVNGVSQAKPITRQVFGPLPTCTFGIQSNLGLATNYQDLWWAAPAAIESGWGLNLVQQGSTLFATWFTYDHDGTPLWLSMTAPATGAGTFAGTLYRSTGPAFSAVPFDPSRVVLMPVGNGSLRFGDGNAGTFSYTVNGVAGSKAITRQVFRNPGTTCS